MATRFALTPFRRLVLIGGLFVTSTRVAAQMPTVDSLKQVLMRTTYVFQGVVQQWNAVADSSLTPSPQTGIVNVTQVFACPQAVGEFGNERVTVRYPNPNALPAGSRAWFLGTGWVVGQQIATNVLSAIPIANDGESSTLVGRLRDAIKLGARDALEAAARAADIVALATVNSISTRPKFVGLLPVIPMADTAARREFAERWSVLQLTIDSVPGARDTSTTGSPSFAPSWVAPDKSLRNIAILAPAATGYYTTTLNQLAPNTSWLFLLDRVTRRPHLLHFDSAAVAFVPDETGIHPANEAAMLGPVLPNPNFTLSPLRECTQAFR